MALYRTERRLTWNRSLKIGYWTAPWSMPLADTGDDYFSRSALWLAQQYPKAHILAHACALPALDAAWPEGRFDADVAGGAALDLPPSAGADSGATAADSNNPGEPPSAAAELSPDEPASPLPAPADLLIVEWPQSTSEPITAWVNGLERALRRNWQANPEAEVLLLGGPAGIAQQGTAIAKHYGTSILDTIALIRSSAGNSEALLPLLSTQDSDGVTAVLSTKGQEIWAGALIAYLREQVRFGPTPDPVNLPEGLWGR